jgi:transposase-like protein
MKCPICKTGEMKKIVDNIKQDGVNFEAFRCSSCGEELMNMQQLKTVAQQYRTLREAKKIVFSQWGNSIAVRIPQDIVKEYQITSGKQGLLKKEKGGIKIIPT